MNEELVQVVWTLQALEDTYGDGVLGDMAEVVREAFLKSLSPHEKDVYDYLAKADVGYASAYDVAEAIGAHSDPVRIILKRMAEVHLVKTRPENNIKKTVGRKRIEYSMPIPL